MSAALDIDTPRGQLSLEQERALLAAVRLIIPNTIVAETPKKKAAPVDGLIVGATSNEVKAVFESKCREFDVETLRGRFNNEWLVTYEKICEGARAARLLRVPYYGFLFLLPDNLGMAIRLADDEGNFLPRIRLERTWTQETCNGGLKLRTNAFIDMTTAYQFSIMVSEGER